MRKTGFKGSRGQATTCPAGAGCAAGLWPGLVWARPRGFTIVELIVVVAVIVLILALAMPALSTMNSEARLSGAYQTINSTLTRAYYMAVGDVNMTAVRFLPSKWDTDDDTGAAAAAGRQHLVIYSYTGMTYDPDEPDRDEVVFDEYFVRREGVDSVRLPEDVWVAPLEALSMDTYFGGSFVLDGKIGEFAFNAERKTASDGGNFLNADDFMIVVDPKSGVRAVIPEVFPLRAYAPTLGREASASGNGDPYQRYGFSGVVIYRREPFVSMGDDASWSDRQDLLREKGRPYMTQRYSGGLTAGMQRPE